jgi:hypothetical protein
VIAAWSLSAASSRALLRTPAAERSEPVRLLVCIVAGTLICGLVLAVFLAAYIFWFRSGWGRYDWELYNITCHRCEDSVQGLRTVVYSAGVILGALIFGPTAAFLAWALQLTGKLARRPRGLALGWSVALPMPAALPWAALAALIVAILVRSDGGSHAKFVTAPLGELTVGTPLLKENVWFIRQESGEVLALYDSDSFTACPIEWRPDYKFLGRTGWFVNSCGFVSDLTGRCFSDACRGSALGRLEITGGVVEADPLKTLPPLIITPAPPINPRQRPLTLGMLAEFSVDSPQYFDEAHVWVVRLEAGEVLALDAESPCPIEWQPGYEFLGRTGWFVGCGIVRDLTGRCFSKVCDLQGLARFPTEVKGGVLTVDLGKTLPPWDLNAEPANPPYTIDAP